MQETVLSHLNLAAMSIVFKAEGCEDLTFNIVHKRFGNMTISRNKSRMSFNN